ncbi:MAG TPA: GDSL-type esterase/lipase family protein [Candidatus Acidoferrales bacterium]|nr:GDSL-type esterase/lipase family protein [Candidatus Acidoferrales bacterium]
MKNFYSRLTDILVIAIVAFLAASCGDFKKTNVVTPPSTNGKVDFTRYVSLGNSLVAGYESGALYESAQRYSYPNQIAQQASLATGSTMVFNQPLISDPGFGILGTTPIGRLQIVDLSTNPPKIEPAISASPTPINATTVMQPYNNLGIPGAILSDMMDTTNLSSPYPYLGSNNNPYFGIVLRNPLLGKSCVQQALNLHPTFVTVEIGDNDILGYATSGGISGYTSAQDFESKYTALIDTLLADAPTAKIAIANIPDVTAIPFFTTILPFIYGLNGQPTHVRMFVQRHHADGSLYAGPADTLHDFILLTAADSLAALAGTSLSHPMPDEFVLDSSEVATARVQISGYNDALRRIADAHSDRIALVDVHTLLNNIAQQGYVSDGIVFTSAFISGGLFGLDGIHPTAQGYGIVANEFIRTINAKFGSNIPLVAISSIPSSIVLAKSSIQPNVLPDISYKDLKSVLQLFDRR